MLEFSILGPLEVASDDGPIGLGGLKQRATLAILLLNANRVVSVERLADDLYAGAPPVTAVTQVQRQISALRRAIGADTIETRAPGYVLRVSPQQLDLTRFERRTAEATESLARGDAHRAAVLLREALGLWRGAPIADLAYESFAQGTISRLEEIRMAALEQRIDADLALGRHQELVAELEALVWDHPLRERLRAQLMLALYRSGRQTEALEAYRLARAALVEGFGIEPSPALQALERAILRQDGSLATAPDHGDPLVEAERAVLVLPSSLDRLPELLSVAEPLARRPRRELIVVCAVADEADLSQAARALGGYRSEAAVPVRTAAVATSEPSRDAVRLAIVNDVELVLLDAPADIDARPLPAGLAALLTRSPADVAMLTGRGLPPDLDTAVFVPFGGGEHDWAALEVAAQIAEAFATPLVLVGTRADERRGRENASRLLADAALTVQRLTALVVEPRLAEPDEGGLVSAVAEATLVVAGISPRWRDDGIGRTRRALLQRDGPTILVHRGPRPGVLAPRGSQTRFSWSLQA